MITLEDLKSFLQADFDRVSKLLIILAFAAEPIPVSAIRKLAKDAGFRTIQKWNVSDILRSSKGKAILTLAGWELTDAGRIAAGELLGVKSERKASIAVDLRAELKLIKDATTFAFVEEAVRCYEGNQLRSAIVMAWLAAVDVLYQAVLDKKLNEFNAEATRINLKWKAAADRDGLSRMKERDFLDRAAAIGVISKNDKTALVECLDRRNSCGHPNSFKIGQNTVAHHIEILILNVFQKHGPAIL